MNYKVADSALFLEAVRGKTSRSIPQLHLDLLLCTTYSWMIYMFCLLLDIISCGRSTWEQYEPVAVSVSGILHNYHNSNRICNVHNLIRGLSGFEYLQK